MCVCYTDANTATQVAYRLFTFFFRETVDVVSAAIESSTWVHVTLLLDTTHLQIFIGGDLAHSNSSVMFFRQGLLTLDVGDILRLSGGSFY